MAKLSVVIPSRNEPYLNRTIQAVFDNARGEVEVVVALDGYWPADWRQVTDRYPNLHTVHSGEAIGMRGGINKAVASAKSRGAKYVAKFDGHCDFGEGFDEILKADMEPDWIVVPRRKRLNPETWQLTDTNKPDVDYHYLSFPDDPQDFGGKGLNGKIWPERALARATYELDEEMSSQGSGWAMHTDYFYALDLMDESNYGKFWNEFQELGLKCWLSGGRVMVNKKTWYAHWHKGKAGRGYHLPEAWLTQGATFTKNWIWNDAWAKQTKPFKWLIEHFAPVPSWPENWEEILYAERKPRAVGSGVATMVRANRMAAGETTAMEAVNGDSQLRIISARYGIPDSDDSIDVTERIRALVNNDSLDIVVNNSSVTPDQNPFRGKKKSLQVIYAYDGGDAQKVVRDEKDWLIIGQAQQEFNEAIEAGYASASIKAIDTGTPLVKDGVNLLAAQESSKYNLPERSQAIETVSNLGLVEGKRQGFQPPRTAPALNDYLIRKFSISPQRLRGPMPIELRDFHRNDLAQLYAELGFKRGAEIGVAEGKYCLVPGTKVLKTDLTWVNVESLSAGDVLIGFDEWIGVDSVKKYGMRAKMKPSVVKSIGRKILPSFLVVTDKGEVAASADHQWVIRRKGHHQPTCRFWCKTSDLRIGDDFSLYSKPWEVMNNYDAGYLAGFFDGEGSYHNQQGIMFAQNPGDTLEKVLSLLERHKFQTGPKTASGATCLSYRLKGRKAAMRFIGTVRPNRFLPTSQRLWLNASTDGSSCEPATITEIKPLGEQEVIGVGTSTKTLIANGFLSHNSEVLLKANPECELLLVDPWHHYSDNPQGKSKERHEFAYSEAYRRTQTSNSYAARMIVDYSMNAVRDIKEDSLDFVYVDGNHLFDFVMQDLIEWSKRVRSGGIVSGDDYYALDQKRWVGGGVVEAVQAYTNAHRIPIWYSFSGHKSVDFMWVKP